LAALVLATIVIVPVAARAHSISIFILPLAFVSFAGLCGAVLRLGIRREFEILALLGVSFRRIAGPLRASALLPLGLGSAVVLLRSRLSPQSLLVSACAFFGTAVAIELPLAVARRRALSRD